jgi:uncharacterized protein YndB with AHSA1/START domain
MKLFSRILSVIGIIIAIPLVVAMFVKKDYSIEKEVIINKPKQEVYNYIVLLENQNNYSKWANMDPEMEKTFRGKDGTVGFVSAWTSKDKNVGSGEQEITKIIEGERIEYELRFKEPMESTEYAYMTVESVSEQQTRVKWGFYGKMQYPMNLVMLFMDFSQMIGDDFSVGLNRLKAILEKE